MIIGFEEFKINGNKLKVELVDKIPEGYNLMKQYKSPSRAGETNKCPRR